jgi:hypothetical protein
VAKVWWINGMREAWALKIAHSVAQAVLIN